MHQIDKYIKKNAALKKKIGPLDKVSKKQYYQTLYMLRSSNQLLNQYRNVSLYKKNRLFGQNSNPKRLKHLKKQKSLSYINNEQLRIQSILASKQREKKAQNKQFHMVIQNKQTELNKTLVQLTKRKNQAEKMLKKSIDKRYQRMREDLFNQQNNTFSYQNKQQPQTYTSFPKISPKSSNRKKSQRNERKERSLVQRKSSKIKKTNKTDSKSILQKNRQHQKRKNKLKQLEKQLKKLSEPKPHKIKNKMNQTQKFGQLHSQNRVNKFNQTITHKTSRKTNQLNHGGSIYSQLTKSYELSSGYKTKRGYKGEHRHHVNQDNFLILQTKQFKFFGVFDGHGTWGHKVSQFIKNQFTKYLQNDNIDLSNVHTIKKSLEEMHYQCQKNLTKSKSIDIEHSGSTSISVFITDNKLFISNVGDSRAIIGKKMEQKSWFQEQLSIDQIPSDPQEAKRIKQYGGIIQPMKNSYGHFVGPMRVWSDECEEPGIAMSRSFGDQRAKSLGVICKPEITSQIITDADKFILLASDGIWDMISNQECLNIIKTQYHSCQYKYGIQKCCQKLVMQAHLKWHSKYPSGIDDITCVLVKL